VDSLPSELLSYNFESGTVLRFGAPDSDVALPERGANLILDGKGSYLCTRDICNLFEAAALSSNHMTCAGVRNNTGHGELVSGRHSLRKVLSKWKC
jgi:hypothetical protein